MRTNEYNIKRCDVMWVGTKWKKKKQSSSSTQLKNDSLPAPKYEKCVLNEIQRKARLSNTSDNIHEISSSQIWRKFYPLSNGTPYFHLKYIFPRQQQPKNWDPIPVDGKWNTGKLLPTNFIFCNYDLYPIKAIVLFTINLFCFPIWIRENESSQKFQNI